MRGLALDPATSVNLQALGIELRAAEPRLGNAAEARMTDLLQVRDLHVRFAAPGGFIRAVTGVSFRVRPQSTVALVGESGSGKSVVSQTILRILPRNGDITRGEILFADPRRDGEVVDIAQLPADGAEMRAIRGGRISIIFQEPMTLAVAAAHDRRPGRRGAATASRRSRPREANELTERDAAPRRLSRSEAGAGAAIRSSCRAGCASAR